MTSEATLYARMEVRIADAERQLKKFQGTVTTATGAMETRTLASAKKMEAAWASVGTSATAAAYQQKNLQMQLGDIGQSLALGMSPLQVLLQQGPQLAAIYGPNEGGLGRAFKETGTMLAGLVTRFAPLLAVLAAGYAAYQLLASSSVEAKNAVSATTQALAEQAAPVSAIKGQIGELADAQKAYRDAIGNTAGQQVSASNTIIAATKAEFEAKRQLFELELKRQQAAIAVQKAALATLGNDMRARIGQQVLTRDDGVQAGTSDPRIGDFTINASRLEAVQKTIDAINADPAVDEIKRVKAELTLNEIAAGKMEEALKSAWSGQPIEIDKTTKATRSATDSVKQATDAWEGLRQVSDEVKAAQAASAEQMKKVADQIATVRDTTASAMGDIRRGFLEGKSAAEVFGNAALNVFDKIASAIETQFATALFNPAGGGLLNSLFGLGGAVVGGAAGAGNVAAGGAPATTKLAAAALAKAPSLPNLGAMKAAANDNKVHVTVGLVNEGLNIAPEVVDVATNIGKAGLASYSRGQGRANARDAVRRPRRVAG